MFNFLTIAGSDSGGGAGIQADIKTATMLGGFATSALTALTAQNTQGVQAIHPIPAQFVIDQIKSVISDITIDVIKSGMLFNRDIIKAISEILPSHIPYILDTVMIAKGGASLLQNDAIESMKEKLFPKSLIVTPNLPELKSLTGGTSITHAQTLITNYGCKNVLIKGGHDTGEQATDILVTSDNVYEFSLPRLKTNAGHGTGCTLSSAIASYIGQGLPLNDAVDKAKRYVYDALQHADKIGHGNHPLKHNFLITT